MMVTTFEDLSLKRLGGERTAVLCCWDNPAYSCVDRAGFSAPKHARWSVAGKRAEASHTDHDPLVADAVDLAFGTPRSSVRSRRQPLDRTRIVDSATSARRGARTIQSVPALVDAGATDIHVSLGELCRDPSKAYEAIDEITRRFHSSTN